MRRALVLALLCSLAACRKVETPARSAPVAEAPAPATSGPDAEAGTGQEESSARAEQPVPAGAVEEAPAPSSAAPAPAAPPPAMGQFVAGQGSEGAREEEKPDTGIYSWVDGDGVVHYSSADEVPAVQRKQARVVESGVTVVESTTPPSLSPPAAAPPVPRPQDEDESAAPPGPGPQPERDEQGLPIPGTMQDTAATRAATALGQQGLDPAAVQRQYEEELRRMNCREKDGVMVCG